MSYTLIYRVYALITWKFFDNPENKCSLPKSYLLSCTRGRLEMCVCSRHASVLFTRMSFSFISIFFQGPFKYHFLSEASLTLPQSPAGYYRSHFYILIHWIIIFLIEFVIFFYIIVICMYRVSLLIMMMVTTATVYRDLSVCQPLD